ncbi:MAG: sporulation transcriptional regulator SpoIIID [Clostridia bacterium]|nr:sporulation transcriptional regulator SpoIIID [Clostridia bacterium]
MNFNLMASELRAVALGEYIVQHRATVRAAAAATGISKSTVHKEVTQRLRETDHGLYLKVRDILELNKSERHIRGGNATREKYRRIAVDQLNQKNKHS